MKKKLFIISNNKFNFFKKKISNNKNIKNNFKIILLLNKCKSLNFILINKYSNFHLFYFTGLTKIYLVSIFNKGTSQINAKEIAAKQEKQKSVIKT